MQGALTLPSKAMNASVIRARIYVVNVLCLLMMPCCNPVLARPPPTILPFLAAVRPRALACHCVTDSCHRAAGQPSSFSAGEEPLGPAASQSTWGRRAGGRGLAVQLGASGALPTLKSSGDVLSMATCLEGPLSIRLARKERQSAGNRSSDCETVRFGHLGSCVARLSHSPPEHGRLLHKRILPKA